MAKEGSTVSGLMDSFATAISLALQHGVPLKVLCEKFAHTRFEPSGWTGNPEIGYAKSVMDYIFRWIQIRFLSGTQLDLFAGLQPPASVPVQGSVNGPANTINYGTSNTHQNPVILSEGAAEVEGPASAFSGGDKYSPEEYADRSAPKGGIAPDLEARSGLQSTEADYRTPEDRGIFHTANAMKDLYEMGDSPSCATCGAIMTRSGSCYRCNECGNTSGCS